MLKKSKKNIALLVFSSSLIFSGCASKVNFAHTPKNDADFTGSLPLLKEKYSDIQEYDRIFASPQETAEVSELKSLWGEPKESTRWTEYIISNGILIAGAIFIHPLLLTALAINPKPRKEYVWNKANYTIEADGTNGLYVGYDERMQSWEWTVNDANSTKK